MATYYSIICPKCKKMIEMGKNRTREYGSPLRICKHCGEPYIDENYIEAAFLDDDELYKTRVSWQNIVWTIIGILSIVLGITWSKLWLIIIGAAAAVLSIIAIVMELRYNPKNDEALKKEILASQERIANPNYILALRKSGYAVPITFIRWAKKAIENNDENN